MAGFVRKGKGLVLCARLSKPRWLTGALVIVASTLATGALGGQQVPAGAVLPNLSKATVVGPEPGGQLLHLTISLQPRDPLALQAFCDSVSDPISPNYLQFITPEEVGERFGASQADVNATVAYLKSQGMTVTLVAKNRMAILADTTVSRASAAFGTPIRRFWGLAQDGKGFTNFRANTQPVALPKNLAKVVLDVSGLEDYTRPQRRDTTMLTPFLVRSLYNGQTAFSVGWQGQGRRVGISNFDGFRLTNVPLFVSTYSLPVPMGGAGSNITVVPVSTPAGGGSAGGEGDLDIQMALGQAPLADIRIYDSTSDLVGVLTREVNDNLVDVVTESYGWNINTATANAAHNQHLSMTAQGITYMCASGDSGTSLEPFSYPDYDPDVLMVGGTVATVNTTTGVRTTEVGWSGSGGGWSTKAVAFNVLPSWQHGTGVPTNVNKRLVPDIALHSAGNPGAYTFYYNGSLVTADGTSFASPVCAGLLTIVEQRIFSTGGRPISAARGRLGRIQDLIYRQNGRPDVYFDITSGANGNLPSGGGASTAHAGWDYVTGWGAVNFDAFYRSFYQGGRG